MSFDSIEHTTGFLYKTKFYCVYGEMFFVVVEEYELFKSTSHLPNVPLTLECVRILSWFISFFYFNCLPDDVLCKIAIWADDTALNSSCDKPSDLLQQVEITYEF